MTKIEVFLFISCISCSIFYIFLIYCKNKENIEKVPICFTKDGPETTAFEKAFKHLTLFIFYLESDDIVRYSFKKKESFFSFLQNRKRA